MDDLATLLEQHQQAVTGLFLGIASAMLSWAFARAVKWLRSDGASTKQKALLESLVKRLQDPTREWREVSGYDNGRRYVRSELHEFDSDGVMLAAVAPCCGDFFLSGDRVDDLLKSRQRKALVRAAVARLHQVREAKVEQALNQAIVQAARI